MLGTYVGQLSTPPMDVTYHADAVDAAFDVITASWAGVAPILDGRLRRARRLGRQLQLDLLRHAVEPDEGPDAGAARHRHAC